MKKITTIICFLICMQSYSQMFENDKVFWFDPGINIGLPIDEKGFSTYGFNLGLNYMQSKTLIKINYQGFKEGKSVLSIVNFRSRITNISLQAGREFVAGDHSEIFLSTGIGVSDGNIRGAYLGKEQYCSGHEFGFVGGRIEKFPVYSVRDRYDKISFTQIFLPIVSEIIFRGDYVGTSISLFANLNNVQSIYGISMKLFLGAAI